jgi:hypothetical protein
LLEAECSPDAAGIASITGLAWLALTPLGMAEGLEPGSLDASPGTVVVSISGDGTRLRAELAGLAVSLMGFAHVPRSQSERETFRLARENLETGDALIRFSTRAGCRLTKAEVNMGSAGEAEDERALSASYEFTCSRPELLDSAALGLFMAFPALERVFIRYELSGIRGDAELNMRRPVVSFVPLY